MPITLDDFQVQTILYPDTNIIADASVNTWSFHRTGAGGDPEALSTAVAAFYQQIRLEFAGTVQNGEGGLRTKVYNLGQPEPRVPVYEGSYTLGASGSGSLPAEAAVCLSFRGDLESGVDPARRRGRVFLGPLAAATSTVSSGTVFVDQDTITAILDAYEAFATYVTTIDFECAVWSRVDSDLVPVTFAWIDNAFDTQRRRGPRPTTRTTRTI